MKLRILLLIPLLFSLLISCVEKDEKQKPEKQISFALEEKSHDYYVQQAELWWKEIEKNSSSEENWYNYYRACRNAQGTADWREDFVNESPYLKLGKDIVTLMEEHIPNTFTYYFVKGSTGGVDPQFGEYLLKAYEMNPKFPGIHGDVITYSISIHNDSLRKEVNKQWYEIDDINPGLFLYARNVLSSVEPNAVLLTQHDNDTYPVWMLQDVEGLRTDVKVINIDFLLLDSYQEPIFEELGIPPFKIDSVDIDDYRENWTNVVHHFLGNYPNERPLYIALTVSPSWYEAFEDKLTLSGLTYAFAQENTDVLAQNKKIIEEKFDLDDVNDDFNDYVNQRNVIKMNVNYLKPFKLLYDHYVETGNRTGISRVKKMAKKIAFRTEDQEIINLFNSEFGSR
jgi:hypothetical protein